MHKKTPLYKYLYSIGKPEVKLSDLKTQYTPIEVASQIEALVKQELISINWKTKTINIDNLTTESTFKSKNKIGQFEREVPGYMKEEKIDINKPFLSNKLKK